MKQADFTIMLAAELRLRGVPYGFPAVAAFVADCWSLIQDDPSPASLASRFTESRGLLTVDRETC
jgi:hypothetical protein